LPFEIYNEKLLMRTFGLGKYFYKLLEKQTTRGQRARNAIATLENLQNSLNEAQIDYTVAGANDLL
jgi:hypothetical protein